MSFYHRIKRIERSVHDMGGSIQCRFCLDGKAGDAAETQALDGSRVPISNDATFTYEEQGRCIHCGCQSNTFEPRLRVLLPHRLIEHMSRPFGGLPALIERFGAEARVFDVLPCLEGQLCQ